MRNDDIQIRRSTQSTLSTQSGVIDAAPQRPPCPPFLCGVFVFSARSACSALIVVCVICCHARAKYRPSCSLTLTGAPNTAVSRASVNISRFGPSKATRPSLSRITRCTAGTISST